MTDLIRFKDDFSPDGVVIKGRWYATDYRKDDDIETRLHSFYDFARERHAIYLRRSKGLPKPWTNDIALRDNKFCNIFRELDRVSEWIIDHIIKPYEGDPNLWFYLCAARVINWPPTLQALMERKGGFGRKGVYSPETALAVMKEIKARREKVITGAYIVNSASTEKDPPHIRGSKYGYIAYRTLGEIWEDRKKVQNSFDVTLKQSVETLKRYRGYGPFIAYQVTVDLTYSDKWLGKASDLNTFNSAGPGTCRGLGRVFHNHRGTRMDDAEKTKLLAFQLKASRNDNYWPNTAKDPKKGFAPLSMSNVSNINCEYDKYMRVCLGQGKMRSKYPGLQPSKADQQSLF